MEVRERQGGEFHIQHFCIFLKGLQQLIMAKRGRETGYRRERVYRSKRRRYNSLSPSREEPHDIAIQQQIRSLEMKIDVLRAQIKLLRREVQDRRQLPARDQNEGRSRCLIM